MADVARAWMQRVALALALCGLLAWLPAWDALARLEHDLLAAYGAGPPPAVGVLVVGIDEPSLAQLALAPPLPRALHARLIGSLRQGGAAALGMDLLFTQPAPDARDDAALAQALAGPLPVVLAAAEVPVPSSQVQDYRQRLAPVFAGARQGLVQIDADEDGVVRRAPAAPQALWRAVADAAGRPYTAPPPGALLRPYAPEQPLPYAHYTQALDAARQLPPGALRGRLVLLGQHTPVGGQDQHATALRLLGTGTQSGVFLHATALINALAGDWVRPVAPWVPWAQAALAVALAAWGLRHWHGGRALAVSAALGALAVAASAGSHLAGWWWPALPTLAALALHLNVGAAQAYWRERARRERLRRDFGRYVPRAVADALARADVAPSTRGERRELSLLFADLAGFTRASEHMPPEAVAQALNRYFSAMARTVHAHGGTLDKFIGDAVMAFWNAPLPQPGHAAQALACAQAMQQAMAGLHQAWQGTPFAATHLRIGLHSGVAAVGHLGSAERFTYTAVGDAVNTAARLEGANKAFGTRVLLSGALHARVPAATCLWLDSVVLAGRGAGLDVFTPCADTAAVQAAMALRTRVQAGDWAGALACWAALPQHVEAVGAGWAAHRLCLGKRLRALAAQGAPPAAFPRPLGK
ncbi:adenylate/guanylate cyclase domain-containing protein [Acidovorax sp. YS12]|nr:adenylate/guanylate cyclase domain-containing protein [Acidovorax sp. YS12]